MNVFLYIAHRWLCAALSISPYSKGRKHLIAHRPDESEICVLLEVVDDRIADREGQLSAEEAVREQDEPEPSKDRRDRPEEKRVSSKKRIGFSLALRL